MESEPNSPENEISLVFVVATSLSSSRFLHASFTHCLTLKLDNNDFIIWCKQILATVRGHKLQHFLLAMKTPPLKFLELGDEAVDKINPDFLDWE